MTGGRYSLKGPRIDNDRKQLLLGTIRRDAGGRSAIFFEGADAVGVAVVDQLRSEGIAGRGRVARLVVDGDCTREGEIILIAEAVTARREIHRKKPVIASRRKSERGAVAHAGHVIGLRMFLNGNEPATTPVPSAATGCIILEPRHLSVGPLANALGLLKGIVSDAGVIVTATSRGLDLREPLFQDRWVGARLADHQGGTEDAVEEDGVLGVVGVAFLAIDEPHQDRRFVQRTDAVRVVLT